MDRRRHSHHDGPQNPPPRQPPISPARGRSVTDTAPDHSTTGHHHHNPLRFTTRSSTFHQSPTPNPFARKGPPVQPRRPVSFLDTSKQGAQNRTAAGAGEPDSPSRATDNSHAPFAQTTPQRPGEHHAQGTPPIQSTPTQEDSPFRFMSRKATVEKLRAWRERARTAMQSTDDLGRTSEDSLEDVSGESPEGMFVSGSDTGYPEPMFADLEVKLLKTVPFLKQRWYDWQNVKMKSFRGPPIPGHRKDAHEFEITHKPSGTHWMLSARPKDFHRFSALLCEPNRHTDFRFRSIQKHLRNRCKKSPTHLEQLKVQANPQRSTSQEREAFDEKAEEADTDNRFHRPTGPTPLPKGADKSEKNGEELVNFLRRILKEVKEPWNILGEDEHAVEERRRGMVVCGFIELSRTSLIGTWENGVKGKEGWARKRRGGRKNDVFCFPDFLVPRRSQRRWLALRSNYLLYFYSPMDITPQELMLIDGYFQVLHKDTQRKEVDLRPYDEDPAGSKEDRVNTRPGGRQHHAVRNALLLRPFNKRTNEIWVREKHHLAILNGFRDLLIDFHYRVGGRGRARVAREWASQLEFRRQMTTWYRDVQADVGRYDAFAPVRYGQSEQHVRWLVDGSSHFEQVYDAIFNAEKEILIADWFLTPEIFLLRAPDGVHPEHLGSRLDRLLFQKANQGVRIFILLYKEMNLPNASLHAKEELTGHRDPYFYLDESVEDPDGELHLKNKSNIVLLRHPDQGRGFIGPVLDSVMWAHHEKAAVIDRKIAFIGGVDLCVGRYDTAEHPLRDDVLYNSKGEVEPPSPSSPGRHVLDEGFRMSGEHNMVDCPSITHTVGNKLDDAVSNIVRPIFEEPEEEEQDGHAGVPNGVQRSSSGSEPSKQVRFNTDANGAYHDEGMPPRGELVEFQGRSADAIHRHSVKGSSSKPILNLFPGQDYSNPRVKDFFKLGEKITEDVISRDYTPRMPWHDIACTFRKPPGEENVEGPVDDLVWHFIQRWNFAKWEKKKQNVKVPWLYPSQGLTNSPTEEEAKAKSFTGRLQVLRSASQWSAGSPREKSINRAYIDLIHKAKHYVYIENQFFISKFSPPTEHIEATSTDSRQDRGSPQHSGPKQQPQNESSCIPWRQKKHGQMFTISGVRIRNPIAAAIVERILRAHKAGETFRVYIVIPLFPAFYGDVLKGDTDPALPFVLSAQTECIRGVFSELAKGGVTQEEARKYIIFTGLRKWDILGNRIVTEQIYIHAKLMIVDDRHVLIGSANINDRSQMGSRDSELAILVTDTQPFEGTMDGKPAQVCHFASSLRLRLFHEHLGIPFPPGLRDVHDPRADRTSKSSSGSSSEQVLGGPSGTSSIEVVEKRILDPISSVCWDMWHARIDTNTLAMRHVFHCVPDDTVRTWSQYEKFAPSPDTTSDGTELDGVDINSVVADFKIKEVTQQEAHELRGNAVAKPNDPQTHDDDYDVSANGSGLCLIEENPDPKAVRPALDVLRENVRGHAVRFPVHFLEGEQLSNLFRGVHKLAPRRVFT
ncbi:uncharacterized protein EV422DRAFT_19244 [Fimicolochytrium jonesii]|uniref:uncharacterized protein n=1 Tax=Fimicolochytrium jonesii TaxID=1396493 RepID=UPI0022FE21A4|nr:uncharacterized protein EV422DRAFT_19244 [Fimicolochytrium jonesii]KAI8826953.1 hypothetical protein EV422DRAFT_19244 [Fimicolochytrium jonesii]